MQLLELLARVGAAHRDVEDAVLVHAEDDAPLERGGRVVEVHDRLLGALERLVGPLDQLLAGLGEHLDHDVVGDQVLGDEHPDEVEVGLAGRREPDLDLLVAHLHQELEHLLLARGTHRVDQCLVAVAQVDRTPARRLLHALGRPGAVGQVERQERLVAAVRHAAGLLGIALVRRGLAHVGRLLGHGLGLPLSVRDAGHNSSPQRGGRLSIDCLRPRCGSEEGGCAS